MKVANYYEILHIEYRRDITLKEIRKAYWDLMKQYHPDNPENRQGRTEEEIKKLEEMAKIINDAFDNLSNTELKQQLDKQIEEKRKEEEKKRREEQIKRKKEKSYEKSDIPPNTKNNTYIFERRDGTCVAIKWDQQKDEYIDNILVHQYRIKQAKTRKELIENKIYGDIDLEKMKRDPNYRQFVLEVLLEPTRLEERVTKGGGYIGSVRENQSGIFTKTRYQSVSEEMIRRQEERGRGKPTKQIRRRDGSTITLREVEQRIIMGEDGRSYEINGYQMVDYTPSRFLHNSSTKTRKIFGIIDFEKLEADPEYANQVANALLEKERVKRKVEEQFGYVGQIARNGRKQEVEEIRQYMREKQQLKQQADRDFSSYGR